MPVLAPTPAQPFDILNTVLNVVRERINDEIRTIDPVGGKLLQNNQDFSLAVVNAGYWCLQEELANLGDTQFRQEVIIQSLPIVQSTDPASQVWLSWYGYNDTQNFFQQPCLPLDLTHPLKVWERWSGMNMPFSDPPMECFMDGIPNYPKYTANRCWEWRDNAIYMPGATQVVDLRIRYAKHLADFADIGTTRWYMQPVPINRCRDALAYYICAELADARDSGDPLKARAEDFRTLAKDAAARIMNRDVAMKQRVTVRRQPRSRRSHQGWGWS